MKSNASLTFLIKEMHYLGKEMGKKKEPGKQRESTLTKLAVIFEDYHSA